jgi:outer membrane protein assembly factor BamB
MIAKPPRLIVFFVGYLLLAACQSRGTPPLAPVQSFTTSQNMTEKTSGQSVAYQINTEHSGYSPGPLHIPLQQLWSVALGGTHGDVEYPIIANGMVVLLANGKLVALDEKTGKKLWAHDEPNDFGWVGPAYDNGTVFVGSVVSYRPRYTGLFAFDERTGKKLWSARSIDISTPPTASSGVVYSSSRVGVEARDESTGSLKWRASIGGDSSPAVTPQGVFVSFACPQTYDLQPTSGQIIWQYNNSGCDGGGGSPPVVYNGLLFVGDIESNNYDGLILNEQNGSVVGNFNSTTTPAFADHLGFFVNQSTLTAQSVPSMKQVWSASVEASDGYQTPPLIVGSIVYLTTITNTLVGYDAKTGKQKVLKKLPVSTLYPNYLSSLSFGDGELVVPDGAYLVAFKGS